jgi:hypothetical protein
MDILYCVTSCHKYHGSEGSKSVQIYLDKESAIKAYRQKLSEVGLDVKSFWRTYKKQKEPYVRSHYGWNESREAFVKYQEFED